MNVLAVVVLIACFRNGITKPSIIPAAPTRKTPTTIAPSMIPTTAISIIQSSSNPMPQLHKTVSAQLNSTVAPTAAPPAQLNSTAPSTAPSLQSSGSMGQNVNIDAYFGVIYTLLLLTVVYLVWYYAEEGFPYITYLTLSIGYFAAFGILFLVPIDLAACVIDRRATNPNYLPIYQEHRDRISLAYNVFFTIILIFNSFLLVFEEYLNTDGYFTVIGRVASSFKRMVVDTILGVIAGVIILGILIGQKVVPGTSSAMMLAAIIVTNCIYETFLMFLLAYGLVEFPRSVWTFSNFEQYLLKIQMKATADYKQIAEHRLSVSLEVSHVKKTADQIAGYGDPKLTAAMKILISECPDGFTSSTMGEVAVNKSGQVTIDTLANLRTKLNTYKDRYRMSQAKVESTKRIAYYLEDLIEAKKRPDGVKRILWSLSGHESNEKEYLWHIIYLPVLYKLYALAVAVCSIFSFLGVICSMKGVDPHVSVYYTIVHNSTSTPAGIVIFVFCTLGYATYVTFWSLFQIRLEGFVELVPACTTPEALSFNVRMVGRLAAPLVFFYLGWVSENGLRSGAWTQSRITFQVIKSFLPSTSNSTLNATRLLENFFPSSETESIISNSYSDTMYTENYSRDESTSSMFDVELHDLINIVQLSNDTYIYNYAIQMPSSFSNFYQLQKVPAIKNSFGTLFPVILIVLLFVLFTNILNRFLVMINKGNLQVGAAIVTEDQLKEGKRQLARDKKIVEGKTRRDSAKRHREEQFAHVRGGGAFNAFSWFGKKKKMTMNDDGDMVQLKEPELLKGEVDRKLTTKLGGFGLGSSWKSVFAAIKAPDQLRFYKDESNYMSNVVDATFSAIDLKLIASFKVYEKAGKSDVYLDLDVTEDVISLKFVNKDEAERWENGLKAWRDYANDSSMFGNQSSAVAMTMEDLEADLRANPSHEGGMIDLDSVEVNENNTGLEEFGIQTKPTGFFGSLFGSKTLAFGGGGRNKKQAQLVALDETVTEMTVVNAKPPALEGWLEKKGHNININGDWQRRYCKIDDSSGTFQYFKSSSQGENPTTIDLKMMVSLSYYEKNGKYDHSRFNINTGAKTFKFKAVSESEGERWVKGIEKWKEWFVMQ